MGQAKRHQQTAMLIKLKLNTLLQILIRMYGMADKKKASCWAPLGGERKVPYLD